MNEQIAEAMVNYDIVPLYHRMDLFSVRLYSRFGKGESRDLSQDICMTKVTKLCISTGLMGK